MYMCVFESECVYVCVLWERVGEAEVVYLNVCCMCMLMDILTHV